MDYYLFTPALLLVQFGRWDQILALPEPAFEATATDALWHFSRALALAGKGQAAEAHGERKKFLEAAATLPKSTQLSNNEAAGVMAVARPYLDGRLALISGDNAAAITYFRQAVAAEDALAYDEPPGWYLPSRDALGAALMRECDYPAAEQVYRDELKRHPESGRALFGLHAALVAQKRGKEAAAVQKRFVRAWREADVELSAGAM